MLKELNFKNKRVLVTGAAGFIASNLVEWLLVNDNFVVGIDDFSTGKRENVEPFLNHPNYEFVEGDIRDYNFCEEQTAKVDYVSHQAALGSVPRSIKNPMATAEVNITGFVNMAFASVKGNIKRFVYASSSSVYGDSPVLPKVEEQIGKPLSPYAISKYTDEVYAENFSNLYGLEMIGLRYFNVFGRRQDPFGAYAAVIPIFVRQMLRGEQVTINGDGYHARDFTYIDNVIEANIRGLSTENPGAVNQVYNVGFGGKATLNDLFEIIRSLLRKYKPEVADIEPHYGPERPGDIRESLASIEKARRLLDYNPEFSLREGMALAIDWYVEYFKKN
jgi:UDP-N-acetylglucosamine 4-epimerase